jgi:ADP-ribose pyrophosphatase YjhB (NUDIX family)
MVLIACGDQILLTRRAVDPQRGLWSISGGYGDFGEDPQDAARRECREELGVDLHELRLLDVQLAGQVIVITYVAVLMVPVTPVPTDDIDRAEWFAPDDLPPLAFPTVVRASERWRGTTKQ